MKASPSPPLPSHLSSYLHNGGQKNLLPFFDGTKLGVKRRRRSKRESFMCRTFFAGGLLTLNGFGLGWPVVATEL